MSTTTVNEAVAGAVTRLRSRAKQQLDKETIAQEKLNAKAASERQLRELTQLEQEYAPVFAEALSLDVDALTRSGVGGAKSLVHSVKNWLGDLAKWQTHHKAVVEWSKEEPAADLTPEKVVARILEGHKSSDALRERAVALAESFGKL